MDGQRFAARVIAWELAAVTRKTERASLAGDVRREMAGHARRGADHEASPARRGWPWELGAVGKTESPSLAVIAREDVDSQTVYERARDCRQPRRAGGRGE